MTAGQELWHEHHKKCGGEYQSPILIVRHRAIPLPLRAVEMTGYHDPLPGPLNLTNNGHSGTEKLLRLEPCKAW
jgi:hypothetical protein